MAPRGRLFGIAVGAPRETDGDDAVAFRVRDPFGASVASSSSDGASCGNAPRGDGGAPRADDGGAPRDDGGAPRDDGGAPRDDGAPPGVKTPML